MSYRKIAIIPARSGSKGLKDKNILDICGKPLIAYSIIAGINSDLFSRVIVSTDSEQYADIARHYHAEVFMRDEALSGDNTSTYAVIEDILKKCTDALDYFVLLQPTSPLRDSRHVKSAVSLFEKNYNNFDFLVSVKEAEHAGILVKPIDNDESLKYFDTDFSNYKRQGYKEYSPNGAIFIGKIEEYLVQKHFFGSKAIAYKMNQTDSVDIDTEIDYKLARLCMEEKYQKGNLLY